MQPAVLPLRQFIAFTWEIQGFNAANTTVLAGAASLRNGVYAVLLSAKFTKRFLQMVKVDLKYLSYLHFASGHFAEVFESAVLSA